MAKQKKSSKKLSDTLERVFDKIAAKLPDNVDVDVAKLTQMACAGGATYIFAEEAVDALQQAALLFYSSEAQKAVGNAIVDNPITRWSGIGLILWGLGFGEETLDQDEIDRLQAQLDKIKEKQLTEEQKIGLALAAAALVPEAGDILKGIGEIVPL